jgi:hypothetical protein
VETKALITPLEYKYQNFQANDVAGESHKEAIIGKNNKITIIMAGIPLAIDLRIAFCKKIMPTKFANGSSSKYAARTLFFWPLVSVIT